MEGNIPDPTWARLGFREPPDFNHSGQNIGIVIIDKIKPHHTIRHLGHRIKQVTVHDDLSIECSNVALEPPPEKDVEMGVHGLQTVLALSHMPFVIGGQTHVGLAPAANYIVLDHGAFTEGEGERLKRGMDWILTEQTEWNIKIILCMGWQASDHIVHLNHTQENSTVQALDSALQHGILVICSNGNTRLGNIMPPIDYFTVGGYNDRGKANRHLHVPYPDEPFGRNGDGHYRPDILAPRVYLTIPFCESKEKPEKISYYWGTSGAATLVTGVAAYLFSKYPEISSKDLRRLLVEFGDPLIEYENNAPRINVGRVTNSLEMGDKLPKSKNVNCLPSVKTIAQASIHSSDEIERGLALTSLVQRQQCTRQDLWKFTEDDSSVVRKIAVFALIKPENEQERATFWERLSAESEGGVRGWYAYGLLQDADEVEAPKWIPWSTDTNWAVRWCVSEYLSQYTDFLPQLEKTHDPDLIQDKALAVLQWLSSYRSLE
ncbi:S8 family serine peptidase [Paenibacillus sp. MABNR03]|uniref:S8 family serine peptidase n=1 Tax=Paenibacillus sp. MABNR03 TaxID=3142626 RepID=UPI003D2D2FA0